jgi:exosortase A-associated hydrolase 1
MSERCLTFQCEGESLVGILHEPAGKLESLGIVVVVGGPQYRVGSHRQFVLMARALAEAGYPVLRYDYRGMGDSEGLARTFEDIDVDIDVAIATLHREVPGIRGVVLFGLCDAASAILMYPTWDTAVAGLILVNPWARTEAGQARAQVDLYYRNKVLQRSFWTRLLTGRVDLRRAVHDLSRTLAGLRANRTDTASQAGGRESYIRRMERGICLGRQPLLLLMSGQDLTAREFDDLCRGSAAWTRQLADSRVRRHDLPGADHTFSAGRSLQDATDEILHWLRSIRS